MTTEGHYSGSEKIHNKRKKKESQEECSKELLELARDILCFEKHMQVATEEENQRYGWVMKKKVRWNSIQVKLQQKMFVELKQELREVESEMEVSYCEPEQGPLLGEDDEAEKERPIESVMDFVKSTTLLTEEMTVILNETKRSYVFETNDLFVISGFVADDRQSFETILKFDEVKYDEESISNESSKVLQKNELIDELLDGGTQ